MLKDYTDLNRARLQEMTETVDRESFSASFHYQGHVDYNRRLQTTGATYNPQTDEILFNPKMLSFGHDTIIGILRHELCHFYVHHLAPDARAHGAEFQHLLQVVGGLRYAPRPKQKVVYRYFYQCKECGNVIPLQNPLILKMSLKGTCGRCGGDIRPIDHEPLVRYESHPHSNVIGK